MPRAQVKITVRAGRLQPAAQAVSGGAKTFVRVSCGDRRRDGEDTQPVAGEFPEWQKALKPIDFDAGDAVVVQVFARKAMIGPGRAEPLGRGSLVLDEDKISRSQTNAVLTEEVHIFKEAEKGSPREHTATIVLALEITTNLPDTSSMGLFKRLSQAAPGQDKKKGAQPSPEPTPPSSVAGMPLPSQQGTLPTNPSPRSLGTGAEPSRNGPPSETSSVGGYAPSSRSVGAGAPSAGPAVPAAVNQGPAAGMPLDSGFPYQPSEGGQSQVLGSNVDEQEFRAYLVEQQNWERAPLQRLPGPVFCGDGVFRYFTSRPQCCLCGIVALICRKAPSCCS